MPELLLVRHGETALEPGAPLAGPARCIVDAPRPGRGPGSSRSASPRRIPWRCIPRISRGRGRRRRRSPGSRRSNWRSTRAGVRSTSASGSASHRPKSSCVTRRVTHAGSQGGTGWEQGESYVEMAARSLAGCSRCRERTRGCDPAGRLRHPRRRDPRDRDARPRHAARDAAAARHGSTGTITSIDAARRSGGFARTTTPATWASRRRE